MESQKLEFLQDHRFIISSVTNCFPSKLKETELRAWSSFVKIVNNFLGNHRADNYSDLVDTMFKSYEKMGCRMSLKMHFLYFHLDFFRANLGAVSDEHGKHFHHCYGKQISRELHMMGDYCWFLHKESSFLQVTKEET